MSGNRIKSIMLLLMLLLSVIGSFLPGVSAGGTETLLVEIPQDGIGFPLGHIIFGAMFIGGWYAMLNNTAPYSVSKVSIYIDDTQTDPTGTFTIGFLSCAMDGSWLMPVTNPRNFSEYLCYVNVSNSDITATGWYNYSLPCDVPIQTATSGIALIVSQTTKGVLTGVSLNLTNYGGGAFLWEGFPNMFTYNNPNPGYRLAYRLYGVSVNVTTDNATEVSETTAILHGDLNQDVNVPVECGFWIGNDTTTSTNFEQNVSCGVKTAPATLTYTVTGLHPGQYYHCRSWGLCSGTGYFATSTDETYFMTVPDPPTGANINETRSTHLHLQWTNQTCVASNQTTVVRMSSTGYPSSPSSGTAVYNGTEEWCNASGLTGGTDYYFSLWTYVNDSGSPFLWEYSDSYETLFGSTNGSTYNVQVRWECDGTWVNLSDVSLANEFTAYNLEETLVYKGYPNATDGNFSFTPTDAAAVVRFRINDTGTRAVVISPGVTNVTIWLGCGDLGTDWGDLQLVTIFFRDFTGYMNKDNHAFGYLYVYDSLGNRVIIHSDYLQADVALRVPLGIGNTYYLGVTCDQFSIDPLGPITIIEEQYEIDLVRPPDTNFIWWELFDISYGWTPGNQAYVDFFDTSYDGSSGVSNVNVTIIDKTTSIQQYTTEPINPWDFYLSTPVTNYTHDQTIQLIITYNTSAQNWVQTVTFLLHGKTGTIPMSSDNAINDMLDDTIGDSPIFVVNPDGTTTIISWAGVIMAFFITGAMFIFSREFAGLGPILAGLIIAFFNVKLGISANTTIVLAAFLFIIGALVLLIEYRRR